MSKGFEQPVMMKIDKIISESDDAKSFMFRHNIDYKPGQFIMVWLPAVSYTHLTLPTNREV